MTFAQDVRRIIHWEAYPCLGQRTRDFYSATARDMLDADLASVEHHHQIDAYTEHGQLDSSFGTLELHRPALLAAGAVLRTA